MNEIKNTQEFNGILLGNRKIDDLAKEQERCLLELINKKDTGFKDEWEYMRWHRYAIALELSQTDKNDFYINNKAMWSFLIGQDLEIPGIREWIIFLIHNFLEEKFAKARIELSNRINEDEEEE